MSLRIDLDTLSPALGRLARAAGDKRPLLEAMGLALAESARRAFHEPALRPAPWPGRATLIKSGALWQSLRVGSVTEASAIVGTDRLYARYHQYGVGPIRPKSKKALFWKGLRHPVGGTKGIPARPFFPFDADGRVTPAAAERVRAAAQAWLTKALG